MPSDSGGSRAFLIRFGARMPGLDVDKNQQLNPGRMRRKQWQGCFKYDLSRMKPWEEQPSGPCIATSELPASVLKRAPRDKARH